MKKWQLIALAAVLILSGLSAAFFLGGAAEGGAARLASPPALGETATGSSEPPETEETQPTRESERSGNTEKLPETAQAEPTSDPTETTEPTAAKPTGTMAASATEPPTTEPPTTEPPETEETQPAAPSCTIYISCASVSEHMDVLTAGKESVIPASGYFLGTVSVPINAGDTVFDILQRVTRDYGIALEFSVSPLYQTAYVEGIGNLYERDCGPNSGWLYAVNGTFPSYGCSDYPVSDGDSIAWIYTLDAVISP